MNIMNSLEEALRTVITFVPKFVAFLVILLIGWFIAKMLRKLVTAGLRKVGFDRLVERGGIKRALENSKYDAAGIVAAVVYFGVLLIALQMAFGVFGPNPVSALLTSIVAWLPKLAVAIIILVVAAAAGRVLGDLAGSALGGVSWGNLAAKGVHGFIVALGVIAALGQIGVATMVTGPVLIAVLATVGGILVVGVGGGMIKPMQQRWERWLHRAEEDVPMARGQVQAYQRGREDALRAQQPTTQAERPMEAGVTSGQHAAAAGGQHSTAGTGGWTGSQQPTTSAAPRTQPTQPSVQPPSSESSTPTPPTGRTYGTLPPEGPAQGGPTGGPAHGRDIPPPVTGTAPSVQEAQRKFREEPPPMPPPQSG